MPNRICFTIVFILVVFAFASFGQERRVAKDIQSFTIIPPVNSFQVESKTTIIEFHGNERMYDAKSRFFLKNVMPLGSDAMKTIEPFMKDSKSVDFFDKGLIDSMKRSFPDAQSIDKKFLYFNLRPAIQGTFSFTALDSAMKGRYLLLIEERSSIYVFSWSTTAELFNNWNNAVEESLKSLEFE